jgi:hypothetical protein
LDFGQVPPRLNIISNPGCAVWLSAFHLLKQKRVDCVVAGSKLHVSERSTAPYIVYILATSRSDHLSHTVSTPPRLAHLCFCLGSLVYKQRRPTKALRMPYFHLTFSLSPHSMCPSRCTFNAKRTVVHLLAQTLPARPLKLRLYLITAPRFETRCLSPLSG